MALAGYKAGLYVTSTPSVALTNYLLTDSGDHKTFTNPTASQRYWDKATAFVIQTAPDGATWTTVTTGFTIQYVSGQVVFTNAVTGATPSCRVLSGAYYPYSFLTNAKQIDVTAMLDVVDNTTFQNPAVPWKTKQATLAGATVKLAKFWDTQTLFINNITNSTLLILIAQSGANANQRYEGYVKLKQDGIKFPVATLEEESVDFEVDGQLYYTAS